MIDLLMAKAPKKVTVIGMGYMGLPTACLLAQSGLKVAGVDINARRISELKAGKLPFAEPGLPQLFKKARGRMEFSERPVAADAFIIAVPTPITKNRKTDLDAVKAAARSVSSVLKNGDLVIIESTIAPGNSLEAIRPILAKSGKRFDLVYCPERAYPGRTIFEMQNNFRIAGGATPRAAAAAKALYKRFVKGEIFTTDVTTAEAVKLMENAYREFNIAFANEVARMAHKIGIDAWEAISLANYHPRVNILDPGPGVGGHCLPVDPWFLVEKAPKETGLLKDSLLLNESMGRFVVDLMDRAAAKRGLKIKRVGVLGVAYRKNLDDARETPALHVMDALEKRGYSAKAADDTVSRFSKGLHPEKDVLRWADCLIIVTDHDRYSAPYIRTSRATLIVDTRNALRGKAMPRKTIIRLGDGRSL